MTLKDRITATALRSVLGKAFAEADRAERDELTAAMIAEGAQTMRALLPNGGVLGTLSLRKGTARFAADPDALERYITCNYPHAIIPAATVTTPAHIDATFADALLKSLVVTEHGLMDPETGEVVPTATRTIGEQSVAFKATADARALVLEAYNAGEFDPMLALTGGTE